ncbi:hypothetical protein A2773_05245 [Candidatus Gottesmanbacteria bacterium RIFCSPHIGHO2_01_FULL_39_10]|uniref:Nucleoside triphosphate pyrophosphatase n=1 Tax=Candidatus Gottesmanbacteria bacterium RIFCSPHIGHO2_01_FULL_39_10 TaxID=1798375 RepID=A0A1F5ZNP0_9BACT|nr:MAG: hypothetical protein A2773_05245 [Candidatus Gottesmanbacteria bacterium RIFCSPHIGHO2_01_FULL_39_10]
MLASQIYFDIMHIHMQLILASASEGRKQLLSLFKIPFKVIPSSVDEDKIHAATPLETIQLRAKLKAESIAQEIINSHWTKDFLILSADSDADLDGHIVGKARNKKEATQILQNFSGRTHTFYTAVYAIRINIQKNVARPQQSFHHVWQTYDRSLVTMKKLTREDIKLHLKLSNYTKYAGAYALFASPVDLISKVEGSLTNVVGLPLDKIIPILKENKLI